MVSDIVTGISLKINKLFGDGYTIHEEDIKQGLYEPCFFIMLVDSTAKSVIGSSKFRRHSFDIQYFPRKNSRAEMLSVAYDLVDGLEYITLLDGSVLRGTSISYRIIDGVLHFYVDYNVFTHVPAETTPMKNVQIETNGRE